MLISNGIRLPFLNHFNVAFACLTIRSDYLVQPFRKSQCHSVIFCLSHDRVVAFIWCWVSREYLQSALRTQMVDTFVFWSLTS